MKSEGAASLVGPSKTRACLTTRCEEAPSWDITWELTFTGVGR